MNKAALYHDCIDFQKTITVKYLKRYKDLMNWKKNVSVLDIGCGDGSMTATVLGKNIPSSCQLVGCDVSPEMVKFARAHYSSPTVRFELVDIAEPLPPHWKGYFQHVVSFYTLNWIPQQQTVFKNIYDLMPDKGTSLIVAIGQHSLFDAYRKLSRMDKWSHWLRDFEQFISPYHDCDDRIPKVRNMVSRSGFREFDVKYETMSFRFDNINLLRGTYKAVSPFHIPEEKMDAYIDDLFKEMQILDTEKYNYAKSVLDGVLNMKLLVIFMEK